MACLPFLGQGEQDFDLCMDVNLRSFMSLMERCRKLGEVRATFGVEPHPCGIRSLAAL